MESRGRRAGRSARPGLCVFPLSECLCRNRPSKGPIWALILGDDRARSEAVGRHQDEKSWALAISPHSLGDAPGARQHLRLALVLALESGVVPPLLWALPATALLLADEGKIERAVELYALASRHPFVANSRWFEDIAGKALSEVAATLPKNQIAVLQERGRVRDLEATAAELLAELSR